MLFLKFHDIFTNLTQMVQFLVESLFSSLCEVVFASKVTFVIRKLLSAQFKSEFWKYKKF